MDMLYASLWNFPPRARNKYLDTKEVFSFQHGFKWRRSHSYSDTVVDAARLTGWDKPGKFEFLDFNSESRTKLRKNSLFYEKK